MNFQLTDTEIKKLRRLGNALSHDLVPVMEIRSLVAGLLRQVDDTTSAAPAKRIAKKEARKDNYKQQLKVAI